jgi:hypothetical protein
MNGTPQIAVLLFFCVFVSQCVATSAADDDDDDVVDYLFGGRRELLKDFKKKELKVKSAADSGSDVYHVPDEKAIIIPNPSKALLVSSINNWIVIQNLVMDAATSFHKPWVDYRNGFGPLSLSDNYWIGLDNIHRLTSTIPQYRLRVEIQRSSSPDWFFAEYESFSVSSESTNFILRVSGYSGNAGDALAGSTSVGNAQGMMFTTYDRDNDKQVAGNCADNPNHGGWWWNYCSWCNINMNFAGSWTVEQKGSDVIAARMMIKLRQ